MEKQSIVTIFPNVTLEKKIWAGKDKGFVANTNSIYSFEFMNSRIISVSDNYDYEEYLTDVELDKLNIVLKKLFTVNDKIFKDYVITVNCSKLIELDLESYEEESNVNILLTFIILNQIYRKGKSIDFIKITPLANSYMTSYKFNNEKIGLCDFEFNNSFFNYTIDNAFRPERFINIEDYVFLIKALDLLYNVDHERFRLCINAITMFNNACRIYEYSPNSAIVLIVSAYESLFALPKVAKTETFVYAFKLFWGLDEKIGNWARQLYELRSHIVHGRYTEKDKHYLSIKTKHETYFGIAKKIFVDSLVLLFKTLGYLELKNEIQRKILITLHDSLTSNNEKLLSIGNKKHIYTYQHIKKDLKAYYKLINEIEALSISDNVEENTIKFYIKNILGILEEWVLDLENSKYKEKNDDFLNLKIVNNKETIDLLKKIVRKSWQGINSYNIQKELDKILENSLKFGDVSRNFKYANFDINEFESIFINSIKRIM
jgi:hypothetical protein